MNNRYYKIHIEYTYKNGDVKTDTFKIDDKNVAERVYNDNVETLKKFKTEGEVKNFKVAMTETIVDSLVSMDCE